MASIEKAPRSVKSLTKISKKNSESSRTQVHVCHSTYDCKNSTEINFPKFIQKQLPPIRTCHVISMKTVLSSHSNNISRKHNEIIIS